jgi:hypothetical protein
VDHLPTGQQQGMVVVAHAERQGLADGQALLDGGQGGEGHGGVWEQVCGMGQVSAAVGET